MSTPLPSISPYETYRRIRVISARERLLQSFLSGEIDERTYTWRYDRSLQRESQTRLIKRDRTSNVYAEEYERLELPHNSNNSNIAKSAARKRLEEKELQYSRSCPICLVDSTCQRSFFMACGHVICRACAEQMKLSLTNALRPACPLCRVVSHPLPLIEDCGMNYDEFVKISRVNRAQVLMETANREGAGSPAYRELLCLSYLTGKMQPTFYTEVYKRSIMMESDRRARNGVRLIDVVNEESARHIAELPLEEKITPIYVSAVKVARRREQLQLVAHLRTEDENCPARQFSRACVVCSSESPRHRCVYTACGHVVCRHCAKLNQFYSCLICREESYVVNLFENLIETNENV